MLQNDEEVKGAIMEWLNRLAAEVYDESIQNVVTHCDKFLKVRGDYVEK